MPHQQAAGSSTSLPTGQTPFPVSNRIFQGLVVLALQGEPGPRHDQPDILLEGRIDVLHALLAICLSICLSVCLSICLSVCLSVCLSIYLSIYLSLFLQNLTLASHPVSAVSYTHLTLPTNREV